MSEKSSTKHRYAPYPTNDLSDLSDWSLDEKLKHIIYDDDNKHVTSNKENTLRPKSTKLVQKQQNSPNKLRHQPLNANKRVTYKDPELAELLEDEKKNEAIYNNVLRELEDLGKRDGRDYGNEDDYVGKVDLDELKNISISSGSQISDFIDWDQIDQLIGKFN